MRAQSRRFFYWCIGAMAAVVVLSNIGVQFLFGNWLTWGALVYPLAFLVTDVANRSLGPARAQRVVWMGFMVGVGCSLIAAQLSYSTLRIVIGSGVAFLVAQLVDVYVFDRLRTGSWWRAPLVSSLIGSALDTTLFFFIAFSASLNFAIFNDPSDWARASAALLGVGPSSPLWVSLAVADFLVKLGVALVALVMYRFVTRGMKAA